MVNHHLDVPYHVLDRKYSYDEKSMHEEDNGSENMIIHGDNLTALKSLLPKYEGRIKCIYYAVFEDGGKLIFPTIFEVKNGVLEQVSRYTKNFFRNEEVWDHQYMECVDVPSSSKRGWDRYFSRTIMGEDYGPAETGRIISILDACVTVEHTVTTQVKGIDDNTDVVYCLDGRQILHENMPVYEHWNPNVEPGSPDDYPWMADDTHKFDIGYQLMEKYPYAIHVLASGCDEFATYGSLEKKLEEISSDLGDAKGADF